MKNIVNYSDNIFFFINMSFSSSDNFFYSSYFLSIESQIVNRFLCSICLKDCIDQLKMIKLFVTGTIDFLVANDKTSDQT